MSPLVRSAHSAGDAPLDDASASSHLSALSSPVDVSCLIIDTYWGRYDGKGLSAKEISIGVVIAANRAETLRLQCITPPSPRLPTRASSYRLLRGAGEMFACDERRTLMCRLDSYRWILGTSLRRSALPIPRLAERGVKCLC